MVLPSLRAPLPDPPLSPLPAAVGAPFMRTPLLLAAPTVPSVVSLLSDPSARPHAGLRVLDPVMHPLPRGPFLRSEMHGVQPEAHSGARLPLCSGLPSAQRCRDFTVETQICSLTLSSWQRS